MPERATIASVLEAITELQIDLKTHIALESENTKKTAEMYKMLVTGNGVPSLQERVRNLENWVGGERRIVWIVITGIVGDLLVRLYEVFGR